jgi:hypothetical protein
MIDGLALDYAGARAAARLAWRPSDRLWQRLHGARGLRALLDAARTEPAGNYLSGVPAQACCGDIDVAFRAQWRTRVAELAGWAPARWRTSIQWCAHLIDAGAFAHLWTRPPLPWMADDPVLARYAPAGGDTAARRALMLTGALAPLARALLARAARESEARAGARRAPAPAAQPLPLVLEAWLAHWRSLWPPASPSGGGPQSTLHALADETLAHRARFGRLTPADSEAARAALADRVLRRQRADPAHPAALFAYLLVLALDLERLRAECLLRAFDATAAARERLQPP